MLIINYQKKWLLKKNVSEEKNKKNKDINYIDPLIQIKLLKRIFQKFLKEIIQNQNHIINLQLKNLLIEKEFN